MTDDLDENALTGREQAALARTRTMARLLDEAVAIPGIGYRVGLDPLLSIAPVSGDVAGAALSLYIIAEATRLGVPPKTLLKMAANVALDTLGGSVPVLGTLVDAAWKANKRNVSLLEDHLADREDVV
ncbi:DUF4112 domain-containing protein [Halococcus thailandensis]|uniref:DUF4112 domain-containing protein n=1 Tax=Halococcus thailandensis JCM 13552 TaxID=1227457 RepID=M0NB05_9EURY|nr:DUF4112 domain-containing protein [Halococcus thailandensis]EMA53845.1 hypothetical protein C451_08700 [Halococcus thailandensis JCM 13552]